MKIQHARPIHVLVLVGLVALIVGFVENGVAFCEQANANFPSINDRFPDFYPNVHTDVDIVGANGTATLVPFGSALEPIPIRRYPIHPGARHMTSGPVFIYAGSRDTALLVTQPQPPQIPNSVMWAGIDFETLIAASSGIVGVGRCDSHKMVQLFRGVREVGNYVVDNPQPSPYYPNQQSTVDRRVLAILQHLHDMPGSVFPDIETLPEDQWREYMRQGRQPVAELSFQDWIVCTMPGGLRCIAGHLDFEVAVFATPREWRFGREMIRVVDVDARLRRPRWIHEGRNATLTNALNDRLRNIQNGPNPGGQAEQAAIQEINDLLAYPACP